MKNNMRRPVEKSDVLLTDYIFSKAKTGILEKP